MSISKKTIGSVLLLVVAATLGTIALATQPQSRMPKEADLNTEVERVKQEAKTIFNDPSLNVTGKKAFMPDIKVERQSADPEKVASTYEQKAESKTSDGLLVFASFSLSDENLKQLIIDAQRVGGRVVLRGFKDGDIKKTTKAIGALGVPLGVVQINPNAFEQYQVTSVPTFVLYLPDADTNIDADGCSLPSSYTKLAGNVTLKYALEKIESQSKTFKAQAAMYQRLLPAG